MDIRSFESKERTAFTFIQNLQDGKVRINSERMAHQKNYTTISHLIEDVENFINPKTNDRRIYENLINCIYSNMMILRLEGFLDGELVYENELQIIQRLKEENKKLKSQNERLHTDNVFMAGELKDRQNLIHGYEKLFTKNKDNKDEFK